jgi:uncharacterized caspase-like protein
LPGHHFAPRASQSPLQFVTGLSQQRVTAALLKNLATPNVEIGTIMRRVRGDVAADTHERQVPWDHSTLIGEVILAPEQATGRVNRS